MSILTGGLLLTSEASAEQFADPEPHKGLEYGDYSDSIAFKLPAGPRGVVPPVRLGHSLRHVDGIVGQGWHLAATRVITRSGAYGAVPNSTGSDEFYLDGQRLYETSPGQWEPEQLDGSKLTYHSGSHTWTLKQAGWTYTFGSAPGDPKRGTLYLSSADGGAHLDPGGSLPGVICPVGSLNLCNIAAWYLTRAEDPFGNPTLYHYRVESLTKAPYWQTTAREHLLERIEYGPYWTSSSRGMEVVFEYKERPDPRINLSRGTPSFSTQRLHSVEGRVKGARTSRYEFEYLDQRSDDCLGQPYTRPERTVRSILSRVIRQPILPASRTPGTPITYDDHNPVPLVIRCLETAHEETTFAEDIDSNGYSDDDAIDVGGSYLGTSIHHIHPHASRLDPTQMWVTPVAVQLDSDGRTDLMVVGVDASGSSMSVAVQFFQSVAGAHPFNSDTGVARAWAADIEAHIRSAVQNGTGYRLGDIDRDGRTDLLVNDGTGGVDAISYLPNHVGGGLSPWGFLTRPTGLDPCDLKYGELTEVNGDGYLDLIVRPHDDTSCPTTHTAWIPNRGGGIELYSSDKRPLALPLELSSPTDPMTPDPRGDQAWHDTLATACSGVVTPPDLSGTGPSPEVYMGGQVRYSDLNSDGLVDAAVSLYGCWVEPITGGWEPVPASAFSRVYWGTGYGEFVPSRQSAGAPF
ncbi:MAG: VCBS repeat-containing protein, partial [Myxococcota bacterium]